MTDEQIFHRFRMMDSDRLGKFGERVWANIFKVSGVNYIPLCKIEDGGAPMLRGEQIILPDYQLIEGAWSAYMDSKAKTTSIVYRKANKQERHGIDAKNYHAYRKFEEASGLNCGIGIVELWSGVTDKWSGSLLIERLSELGEPIRGESTQRHMVYWPRKLFRDVDSKSPSELVELYKGMRTEDVGHILELVFNPQTQGTLFQ